MVDFVFLPLSTSSSETQDQTSQKRGPSLSTALQIGQKAVLFPQTRLHPFTDCSSRAATETTEPEAEDWQWPVTFWKVFSPHMMLRRRDRGSWCWGEVLSGTPSALGAVREMCISTPSSYKPEGQDSAWSPGQSHLLSGRSTQAPQSSARLEANGVRGAWDLVGPTEGQCPTEGRAPLQGCFAIETRRKFQ